MEEEEEADEARERSMKDGWADVVVEEGRDFDVRSSCDGGREDDDFAPKRET